MNFKVLRLSDFLRRFFLYVNIFLFIVFFIMNFEINNRKSNLFFDNVEFLNRENYIVEYRARFCVVSGIYSN